MVREEKKSMAEDGKTKLNSLLEEYCYEDRGLGTPYRARFFELGKRG